MEEPLLEQEAPVQNQEHPAMWDEFGYVDDEAGNGNEIQGMIPPAAVFDQIEENNENAGVGQMYDQNIGHQNQGPGVQIRRTARRSGRMDSRCIGIINKCHSRMTLEYSRRRSFRGTVTIEMSGMGTKDSFTISKRHSRTCQEYSWHRQIRGTILIKTQFLNGIKDKGDMAQHRLRGNRADSFHMLIAKG